MDSFSDFEYLFPKNVSSMSGIGGVKFSLSTSPKSSCKVPADTSFLSHH